MKANAKKETIYANIIMLAVFFFAFLGTEYLFDNCMMYVTDASGVVRAQNQMLGVSAIGFLLYNWISGFLADKSPWVTGGTGLLAFGVGAGCMGCIILHAGYCFSCWGCLYFICLQAFSRYISQLDLWISPIIVRNRSSGPDWAGL